MSGSNEFSNTKLQTNNSSPTPTVLINGTGRRGRIQEITLKLDGWRILLFEKTAVTNLSFCYPYFNLKTRQISGIHF